MRTGLRILWDYCPVLFTREWWGVFIWELRMSIPQTLKRCLREIQLFLARGTCVLGWLSRLWLLGILGNGTCLWYRSPKISSLRKNPTGQKVCSQLLLQHLMLEGYLNYNGCLFCQTSNASFCVQEDKGLCEKQIFPEQAIVWGNFFASQNYQWGWF